MLVATTAGIAGHLLLDGRLGSVAMVAALAPALAISVPLIRAQVNAPIARTALPPEGSESSAERALRESERADALEEWRRSMLKSGGPVLMGGAAASVLIGAWAPFLVTAAAVAAATAAFWPGAPWRGKIPPVDSAAEPAGRLSAGEDSEDTASSAGTPAEQRFEGREGT